MQTLFSSGNLIDGKAAIPLLKGIQNRLFLSSLRYQTLDAGYDYARLFMSKNTVWVNMQTLPITKKNEREFVGYDEHFALTCFRKHSYRYDSYDPKYETLKYTRAKECSECPLNTEGICQKVYNVKITTDLRKYSAPARESQVSKTITKRRSSVERVNGYLNELLQLNNVRYRTGQRTKSHFDLVTLIYNASKKAADRLGSFLK